MTSKERVKAILNKQIPDQVPWGEWAIDFDTVGKVIGHETYYRAKAKYGDHFACMGGITVETLVSGTPEDVRREVRFAIEHYKEGGRWIFGSTHL